MRKWIVITAAVLLVLLAAPIVTLHVLAPRIHSYLRDRTEELLRARFASEVEISDFAVSLAPRVHITISGLILRHKGRTDIPPLVQVSKVSAYATLRSLLRRNPEITFVQLEGLRISTPPRVPGGPPLIHGTDQDLAAKYPVLVDELVADDADIVVLNGHPSKPPHEYPIHHLHMENLSFDRPADFQAILTNAVPKGEINSFGQFGPWLADDPAETNTTGKYTFYNADLGTLKGLNGTLSSTGQFSGPLDYLSVEGQTDTPNFSLRTADHPVALHTDFSATVDGTNGNTYLKSVTARFLHTTLQVSGKIVDEDRTIKGRTIVLDAVSRGAHVEDLIRLTTKSSHPVMTGDVRLRTKIVIPERNQDLLERMRLQGQFGVGDIQFTNSSTQGKIDTLSRKGQGQPKDMDITDVVSELKGNFGMKDGVVDFPSLDFGVTGAAINLSGTYNLDSEALDFHGKLKLQAKLSQTTTGAKSFFLKAVDPFFKGKDAGTVLAIKVTGTKENPSFGLDHGKSDASGESSTHKGQ
jgi:AsmA-like C-terminal region